MKIPFESRGQRRNGPKNLVIRGCVGQKMRKQPDDATARNERRGTLLQ